MQLDQLTETWLEIINCPPLPLNQILPQIPWAFTRPAASQFLTADDIADMVVRGDLFLAGQRVLDPSMEIAGLVRLHRGQHGQTGIGRVVRWMPPSN